MAPEMIRHEMYDTRADVYSFGVLLAEVLAQKLPYADLYCTPVQARSSFLLPLCCDMHSCSACVRKHDLHPTKAELLARQHL